MPTTRAHKFCNTQPTTSAVLLRIQLMITPMIPGNASAAFTPDLPKSHAKALGLLLSHSFKPLSSLREGPPYAAVPPPPPGNNVSTSTLIAIPIAVSITCSLNRVRIFSPNEVSLSNALAIISLKLVIWFVSLPLRRSIDSCLPFKSSLSLSILFLTLRVDNRHKLQDALRIPRACDALYWCFLPTEPSLPSPPLANL